MNPKNLLGAAFPLVAVLLVVLASLAPGDDDRSARAPGTVAVTQSTYACPAGSVITIAAGQVEAGTSGTASSLPGRAPCPRRSSPSPGWQQCRRRRA